MPRLFEFPAYQFRFVRYCGVVKQPSLWNSVRFWYSFLLLCSFTPLHVWYLAKTPATDLVVTCEEIMLLQLNCVTVLKFNQFVTYRTGMFELVEAFERIQKSVRIEEFPRFVKCNEIHAKLLKAYAIGTIIVLMLYELNAIVASVALSLQQNDFCFVAPFSSPFDYQHPIVFAVVFVYNFDAMLITALMTITIDTYYSEMASNLTIHFDLVGERFAKLDLSAYDAFANRELRNIITYHSDVLSLAQKMVQLFQKSTFYLLLLVSTILCLLGYEFVMVSNIYKRMQVAILACIMIGQAAIYTYHGSAICAKQIYFCLMRAQKPIIMKSGFIEASLPTLKKILSSSASYITMLMSLEPEGGN
uniref:Odorant receptor n=1 Tax=Anopheles christyi TaxID=43041 RepID=A0A182KA33_9DIPT